jgi:hypothetical protein
MKPQLPFSEAIGQDGLAILVACQVRGPLTPGEIAQIVALGVPCGDAIQSLLDSGLAAIRDARVTVTQSGRQFLDEVVEGIESHLTPDAPEYVQRYRRESATIPFNTNTVWAEAVCVNIRVDPAALRPLVPEIFELDLYQGSAFVSLTASRLKDFGLGRLPRALRTNFYQATYRAHVTFTDFRGRKSRGCYFVRSETNSQVMSLAANMLPEFRAHHCSTYPILMARQGPHFMLTVDSGDDPAGKVVLVLDTSRDLTAMPNRSIFPSISDAYDFIVDFHDAFSYDPDVNEVFLLQIERGDWAIHVVEPVDAYFGYVTNGPFPTGSAQLDSIFYFTDVPYRWLPLLKERISLRR